MRIPKILGGGLLLLALALTNPACGSEGAAAQPEAPTPAAAAARAEASGRTTEPAPTRPQRLDHLLRTPTAEPEAVAVRASSEEVRAETKGGTSGAPAAEQTGGTDPLVPEDARFTDQVLLQDIYERIDLEQFALDPRDPITRPEIRKEAGEHHLWSTMPHPMVHQHSYLHIFPDLERIVEVQRETGLMRDITYNPLTQNLRAMERNLRHEAEGDNRRSSFSYDRLEDLTGLKDRMTYFIYHPWFEPVFPNDGTRRVQIGELDRAPLGNYELDGPGPYWFGNNSTRGVLAETVAQLIREARKPGVTPAQRVWWNEESEKYRTAFPSMTWYDHGGNWTGEMRDWTIEEFIRTTVMSEETIQLPRDRKSGRTDTKYWNDGINRRQNPKVEWEILHPRLPILRITAHAKNDELPLQNNPEGNYWDTGGSSTYSVSFVISLQQRWDSFQDPNRWIIRFREDMESYWPPHHLYSEDSGTHISESLRGVEWQLSGAGMPYPNYWHHTDYMQHRIIGPVVLTVHSSAVLEPGTYSRVPRITHWEAPGHILTEQQIMRVKQTYPIGRDSIYLNKETVEYDKEVHRFYPDLGAPNAGWPLPGHVMTGPRQGPGTDVWREYGMEGYDW